MGLSLATSTELHVLPGVQLALRLAVAGLDSAQAARTAEARGTA
jgi:hypothetical protein